jgi:hypothetical protein
VALHVLQVLRRSVHALLDRLVAGLCVDQLEEVLALAPARVVPVVPVGDNAVAPHGGRREQRAQVAAAAKKNTWVGIQLNQITTFTLHRKPLQLTIKPNHPLLGAGGSVRLYIQGTCYPNPTAPLTSVYPKSPVGETSSGEVKPHLSEPARSPALPRLALPTTPLLRSAECQIWPLPVLIQTRFGIV